MAAFILYDTEEREKLYPLTLTRPIAECRTGILTIREKWEALLGHHTSTSTTEILSPLFPLEMEEDNYWINGGLLPDRHLSDAINHLPPETSLISGNQRLITRSKHSPDNPALKEKPYNFDFTLITYPWNLFQHNGEAIRQDFATLAKRSHLPAPEPGSHFIAPENIFIEKGAKVLCSTLNASTGPIYIGKDALIMEGSHIRGPFALRENSVIKMGAKIYGDTTIGPFCIAGGEIKSSILFGHSNKAHEGYLGDSVIGEWCNWGAGTTCSNLKNSAQDIKIWVQKEQKLVTVSKKCGVMMGDLSRTAVQTRINSGTIVGVSAHLFDPHFPPKHVPSFYWKENERYQLDKALRDARGWMQLKGKKPDEKYMQLLKDLYNNLTIKQ